MSDDGSCSGTDVDVHRKDTISVCDLFFKGITLSEDDSFYLMNRVVENFSVLKCSERYLDLCSNFDEQVSKRISSKSSYQYLPTDLQQIEDGVDVLCVAYAEAVKSSDVVTQNNIRASILSLSSIYENKTAEAYFSACDVVLDAFGVADKPEVLKKLVDCRDGLQKLHSEWPIEAGIVNMSHFNREVEIYGKQIGIDGLVAPEKVRSFSSMLPQNIVAHTRCA